MDLINRILNTLPRLGLTIAWTGAIAVVMAGLTGAVSAQEEGEGLSEEVTQPTMDEVTVTELPPPDARRVYVTDGRAFEVFTHNFAIDGNTGIYGGHVDTGLLPVPAVPPGGERLYIADTHWSDYSQGTRNDLIRVYDPRTLTQIGKIDIPEGRFLAMSQASYTQISPDGRYLSFYQFVPTNGVGIVDLEAGEFGEFLNVLDTPQCFYTFPTTNRRVVMHCRDGSLLQVTFDENGEEVDRSTTEPFHEPVEQPTFNDPAFSVSAGKIFFVDFWGTVFPVDISGDQPQVGEPWSLVTEEERNAGWKPGGWQPATFHPGSNRLYVLMDQRARWAQNTESNYVWVYDATSGEKVDEIHLAHEARSLHIDHGSPPYLYALSSHHANLTIYDSETGAVHSFIDELGHEPVLVVGAAPPQ
jgi:methylamine dehydrogenase heavy chain